MFTAACREALWTVSFLPLPNLLTLGLRLRNLSNIPMSFSLVHSAKFGQAPWPLALCIHFFFFNFKLKKMNNKYFSTSVPLHSPELWWKHSSRWSRSAQSLSGPPWTDGSSMPRKSDKSHRDPGSRKVKAGGEKWFEALKAKLDMLADMCVRYRSVLNGGFFHFDNTKRILCFNWRGKKGGKASFEGWEITTPGIRKVNFDKSLLL